jgi:malonyl-CoA O-methyltransferase
MHYFDPRAVARTFDRASGTFERYSGAHSEIRTRLLERLDYVKIDPRTILDLGTGHGDVARELKTRYRKAQVVAVDISGQMLRAAARNSGWLRKFDRVRCDAIRLPFKDRSLDLVVSNLMLHWCQPPDEVFKEIARVLTPGGLLMFTTVGPDTLRELRNASSPVSDAARVHPFIDMHDLGDALIRARLAEPVMDVERLVVTYSDVDALLRELKGSGAANLSPDRPRGLSGKAWLPKLKAALAPTEAGRISVGIEIVYGHAWGSVPRRNTDGSKAPLNREVHIPVGSIRRR